MVNYKNRPTITTIMIMLFLFIVYFSYLYKCNQKIGLIENRNKDLNLCVLNLISETVVYLLVLLGLILELLGFLFIAIKDWFIVKNKKDKDFKVDNYINIDKFFIESFWLIVMGVLFQIIATFIQIFILV